MFCILIVTFRTGAGRIPLTADPYDFYRQFQLPTNYETLIAAQGVIEVISSIGCSAIVDLFQRKVILQLSCWLMNGSLIVVLIVDFFDIFAFVYGQWIRVVCILFYYALVVGFMLMFTTILVSEIASSVTQARGLVTCTSFFVSDLLGAVYTEFFPTILQKVGIEYVLIYFFVNSCLLSLTIFFVPETSGKGLHLIGPNTKENDKGDSTDL